MPPKKADGDGKTYTEDVMALLLAVNGITGVSKVHLNIMSSLDGTRTASGFEHQFRSTFKKAKELRARIDSGEDFKPVTPSKKRGKGTSDSGDTPNGSPTKRGASTMDSDTPLETPTKKVKITAKSKITPKPGRKPKGVAWESFEPGNPLGVIISPEQEHFNDAFHADMIKREAD